MSGYVELDVTSNFSFLRGASHPQELVETAAALGHAAAAIADWNSLAGVVRAHEAAKEAKIRLIVGSRLVLEDGAAFLCFPTDRAAYGRLSQLLTLGKRRVEKGECKLAWADVVAHAEGQILIALPPDILDDDFAARVERLAGAAPGRAYLAARHLYRGDDAQRLHALAALADAVGLPLVASNAVLYHAPQRRPLQDVVTCIREGCTVDEAGLRLLAHAERHLKPPEEMARLFRACPEAVARSVALAERCRFSLDELRYEYPAEITTEGRTPQEELEKLTWEGAAERCPDGVPDKVKAQLRHELDLIARLSYAPYFLTVHDIVRFARSKGILCQGRGSAANSAVCFYLGITAVDPMRFDLLFERFVSDARNEPPDIDVDFEHERREEVIQYIYAKYGRERAGIAATVSCYRARGAIREVGKALGLSLDVVAALAGTIWGWSLETVDEARVREAGLDPDDRTIRLAIALSSELIGFPRHLSQHVGGFVITRGPLAELVPIENAAMPDRTVIEWDKDDLDTMGMLKIDVLGLGMLTCIRKSFELLKAHDGLALSLATVPAEDPATYAMLCQADSIGVFQVESRAQMTMLPRMKPRRFYDLVIEVAIVRPGPIQGDMVHPYLRRRNGEEEVAYPSEELRRVLEKTLGIPLFQEQAMSIAIVGAGFTPAEADQLRRAMATFRKMGIIHEFRDKMIGGMIRRGYDPGFATRCFQQIEGFGTYGFPESHAASFALLVYVSAWIKCHYPDVFAAALLNSQPMGFYAPAQIVRDAREHGIEVREVDVNHSHWDCTLEPRAGQGRHALRLGFRQVKGMAEADGKALAAARTMPFRSIREIWRRAGLGPGVLEKLARADAFRSLGLDRRQALWAVKALDTAPLPLFAAGEARHGRDLMAEPDVVLPAMRLGEHVVEDYRTLHLTLKRHPMAFLRHELDPDGIIPTARLAETPAGKRVRVAGLTLVRQRPGSASGVIFITIEDETGIANLIVWPNVFETYRRAVLGAGLLACTGRLQREGIVMHVVADRLDDLTPRLARLGQYGDGVKSHARADALQRPGAPDPRDRLVRSRDFR